MEALALPAPGTALKTETPTLHRTVTSGKYVELEQALRRFLWAAQLKFDFDADKLLMNC